MRRLRIVLLLLAVAMTAVAERRTFDFVVAKDGSSEFTTIQAAINAVPDYRKTETRIYVSSGVYKEKVVVAESKQNVTLVGENLEATVIENDDYAKKLNRFGEEMGTSGSASFYVYAPDFHAENLTFANTAGPVGQAVAMFVAGDRAVFSNCRFKGFQDTLYTYGRQSRQLYRNCYIEGTVDFIFGSATAFFENCRLHALRQGYLTAASTPEGRKYGYVFQYCTITAEKEVTAGVVLGRPWRPYAKTAFIGCTMGKFITPEGWSNWGSAEKEQTTLYGEADSYDFDGNEIDLSKRVAWAHKICAADYEIDKVLADETRPDWYK